jgi:hypothetical protein
MYSTAKTYYDKAKSWVQQKIVTPISSTVGSMVATAKQWWENLRGWFWNHPIVATVRSIFSGPSIPGGSGGGGGGSAFGPPNTSARGPFDNTANALISGLSYEGYGGHQKSIAEVFSSCGGNCVDTSLALLKFASLEGHSGELIRTTWNGNPHIATKISGKIYDPSNKMLTGSWNLPPAGPGYGGGLHVHQGAIVIHGPIYGVDDLDKRIEKGLDDFARKYGF